MDIILRNCTATEKLMKWIKNKSKSNSKSNSHKTKDQKTVIDADVVYNEMRTCNKLNRNFCANEVERK